MFSSPAHHLSFFIHRPTSAIYTLSLHDALPICPVGRSRTARRGSLGTSAGEVGDQEQEQDPDRKSTRLNSSHRCISYAVFCLKKKKDIHNVGLGIGKVAVDRYHVDKAILLVGNA